MLQSLVAVFSMKSISKQTLTVQTLVQKQIVITHALPSLIVFSTFTNYGTGSRQIVEVQLIFLWPQNAFVADEQKSNLVIPK